MICVAAGTMLIFENKKLFNFIKSNFLGFFAVCFLICLAIALLGLFLRKTMKYVLLNVLLYFIFTLSLTVLFVLFMEEISSDNQIVIMVYSTIASIYLFMIIYTLTTKSELTF